jgi:hypothetical protein
MLDFLFTISIFTFVFAIGVLAGEYWEKHIFLGGVHSGLRSASVMAWNHDQILQASDKPNCTELLC